MDLMEICHSPELILRAYESLLAESERSPSFRDILLTLARRTSIRRKKVFAGEVSAALSARQFEALRTRTLRFNDKIAKEQPGAETQSA